MALFTKKFRHILSYFSFVVGTRRQTTWDIRRFTKNKNKEKLIELQLKTSSHTYNTLHLIRVYNSCILTTLQTNLICYLYCTELHFTLGYSTLVSYGYFTTPYFRRKNQCGIKFFIFCSKLAEASYIRHIRRLKI